MRILAKYSSWGYRKWAFLRAVIEIKDLKVRGVVDFLIDTGAGQTILSERDAKRLGLAYQNFPRGEPAVGVGGVANTYKINKKVTFYFVTVDGGIYRAVRRGIEVLEEPGEEKQLPSLLGLEFLEDLHFKLTYDMPTQAIFLEI
jgi:predicted aspartyl protease